MASLRNTAQSILEEARDGIAWMAFYRVGRGWEADCFWPEIERDGTLTFEAGDEAELKGILAADRDAIFVNGYYTNLGMIDETDERFMAPQEWFADVKLRKLALSPPVLDVHRLAELLRELNGYIDENASRLPERKNMKKIERICKHTMQRAAQAGIRLASGLTATAGAAAACIGVRFPDAAVEATVIVGAAVSLGWALRGWRK